MPWLVRLRACALGSVHADLAISWMEEAVGYWMQLAGQVLAAFGPWLVRGMTDLAVLLEGAGRIAEAEEIRAALRPPG